jgi:hypothetical protein
VPAPADDKSAPFVIEPVDGKPAPAKLVVPKKLLGQMKAELDTHDGSSAVAHNKTSRFSMFLAGMFLTLSITCTGLWLVRQRFIGTRTAALVLTGIALLSIGGAVLWANGPPPFRAAPVVDNSDRIIIEVVDQGEAVKLVVHKSRLAKLVGPVAPIAPLPLPAPAPAPKSAPGVKPDARGLPAPSGTNVGTGTAAPAAPPVKIPD